MSDGLLSISSAFGGAYSEFCSSEDALPGAISSQLQAGEGLGYQR